MLDRIYWWRLYKDIKLWIKFAKIAKQSKDYLEEHKLRVDKLGRIYTVINLPEEIAQGNEYMHEAWVFQNLKPFTEVILKIGLAGHAYPEVSKIDEVGTSAYLVVLYPEVSNISIFKFLWNVVLYTGSYFIIKFLINLISNHSDTISGWWTSFSNLFS